MDERKTGSFHLTGAGQSGGVSGSEARLPTVAEDKWLRDATRHSAKLVAPGHRHHMLTREEFLALIPKASLHSRLLAALKEFDAGARNHGMTWQRPFIAELEAAQAEDGESPWQ